MAQVLVSSVELYASFLDPTDALNKADQVINKLSKLPIETDNYLSKIFRIKGDLFQMNIDLDSSLIYLNKAIAISELNAENSIELNLAYAIKSRVLFLQEKYDEAEKVGLELLDLSLKSEESLDVHSCNVYKNLSNIYTYQGKYEKALYFAEFNLECLETKYEKDQIEVGIGVTDLALVYNYMDDYTTTLQLYDRAREIFYKHHLETGSKRFLAYIFQVIGQVYTNVGESQLGIDYNLKSAALKEEIYGENNANLYYDYLTLGDTYREIDKVETALLYYEKSKKILDLNEQGLTRQRLSLYHSIIQTNTIIEQFDIAQELLDEAWKGVNENDEFSRDNLMLSQLLLYVESSQFALFDDYIKELDKNFNQVDMLDSKYADYLRLKVDGFGRSDRERKAIEIAQSYFEKIDLDSSATENLPILDDNELLFYIVFNCLTDLHSKGENIEVEMREWVGRFERYFVKRISGLRKTFSVSESSELLDQIYDNYLNVLLSNSKSNPDNIREALLASEKHRSIILKIVNSHDLIQQESSNLSSENRIIANQVKALQDSLNFYESKVLDEDNQQAETFAQISKWTERYATFKDSIIHSGSDFFRDLFQFNEPDFTSLKNTLEDNEILLSYEIIEDSIYFP